MRGARRLGTPPIERDACGIGLVADTSGRSSREIVDLALTGLACVSHRGAIAADGLSGDGAGLLAPIPRPFFSRVAAQLAPERAVESDALGVVTAYLDRDDGAARAAAKDAVAAAAAAEGIGLLGWRDVPIDDSHMGRQAHATLPAIVHGLLVRPAGIDDADAERRALRLRRRAEATSRAAGVRHYFASCSFSLVTYKALVISDRLVGFYPDLADAEFVAPLVIFHSRFSTNTSPAWERAQPFRHLCHNGEINTITGNQHRMAARGVLGTEAVDLGPEDLFRPLLDGSDSDSGKLDTAVELLLAGGRDLRHSVAMLVPEAWEQRRDLAPEVREFFRFHSCLTEPWDGPAGLLITDGRRALAALDRNGLRPLRVQIADDGIVVCASEAGAVPLRGHGKVRRGRLGPGQMLAVDPDVGVQEDGAVKRWLGARAPYAAYTGDGLLPLSVGEPVQLAVDPDSLARRQVAFGVTKEEVAMVLKPMATDAKEPTFAMGDDTPLAAVALKPRLAFHFLRQRFAQVTNPPIDHLRERIVMSLRTCLGPRRPLLSEDPTATRLFELRSFFVYPNAVDALLDDDQCPFGTARLDATFAVADGAGGLETAVRRVADEAVAAVRGGAGILVLSDNEVGSDRAPVPSLFALGGAHHRLVAEGIRQDCSLVVECGDARDTHSVACLLGYGADAISPRGALEAVAALADDEQLGELHAAEAQAKFQAAIEDGVLKILSKMGVSTIDGYRGAQIFEALGLAHEVVDACLRGTPAPVGGIGFEAIGADALARHAAAYGEDETPALDEPGFVRHRKRGAEYHSNNPDVVNAIHLVSGASDEAETVEPLEPSGGNGARAAHLLDRAVSEGRAELYDAFRELAEDRPVTELHDLLELVAVGPAVPVEEFEDVSEITKRFSTGAMSHGALSAEAHETLAVAMNLIGGKSNCGEGGEDRDRFRTRGGGRDRNSRIKQIASGRFGVTPEYCAFADELNIKMAQGSKPGEGGQLPGHKVSAEIARLRHTQPGVGLISPPPHHDIYSIEDLAQLIYDLKQVNPSAAVSVKLVAETGVGQIACGVVKALADAVLISGANGGTGASPLSSIKYAGMPWELGLAEAQQALVGDGLRDRVRLRVDGGFKTGRDVVVAALLGADEYSFGTAALLAEGCIMVRACHRDTCPTGIATQRPNLRAKFRGTPEGVAQYFLFVADEVRRLLASLGFRRVDEAIGRVDALCPRATGNERADALDVSALLVEPADAALPRRFCATVPVQRPRSRLDEALLHDGFRAVWEGDEIELEYEITNADRTVGASLGGAIGLEWGEGLPPGTVRARFVGSAGQSFGAFVADGMDLELVGEANDYLGKGLGGGRIAVRPPEGDAGEPVLAGNTVLYGATGGQVFIAGRAGERFCVRNSGATAVVEGTGDHACEYMTGGTVVVLGPTGVNFGAGMTGGEAYVYDPDGALATRLNRQLVDAGRPTPGQAAELRFLLERHRELTGSPRAAGMLGDWDATLRCCWRVAPVDEVARIERAHEGLLGAAR